MSEHEGGGGAGGSSLGTFLLGLAAGALLGVLFAPDDGAASRKTLGKKLAGLKRLAADHADDVRDLIAVAREAGAAGRRTAKSELRQRLAAARGRRRGQGTARAGAEVSVEDDDSLA